MKKIITDLKKLCTPSEQIFLIDNEKNVQDEAKQIIAELKEVFDSNKNIFALSAPQIGINKRVFGIRFDDTIKFFINPIITKKSGLVVSPETFASMPNKEILIGRPEEVTAIYYTENFKYEDNKFLGAAAKVFDQMAQVLDGVLPDELGLVSDIAKDGSLSELSEDEIKEAIELWKQYVKTKLSASEKEINSDENLAKMYKSLQFTESVINGRTTVYDDSIDKKEKNAKKLRSKEEFNAFIRRKK